MTQLSIYPVHPVETAFQSNRSALLDEGKFFAFTEGFQLVNVRGMTRFLKAYHFTTPNKIVISTTECQ